MPSFGSELLLRVRSERRIWNTREACWDRYSAAPFVRTRSIYIHIPKTAGMSVVASLYGCMGAGHTPITYFQERLRERLTKYFIFTFVRCPYARLFSAYRFMASGGANNNDQAWAKKYLTDVQSFREFVLKRLPEPTVREGLHFLPQVSFVRGSDGTIAVDYVGRFENLESDFNLIANRIGMQSHLSSRNRSPANALPYYDREMRSVVSEVYSEDFEQFGYSAAR